MIDLLNINEAHDKQKINRICHDALELVDDVSERFRGAAVLYERLRKASGHTKEQLELARLQAEDDSDHPNSMVHQTLRNYTAARRELYTNLAAIFIANDIKVQPGIRDLSDKQHGFWSANDLIQGLINQIETDALRSNRGASRGGR